jgi:hypothetical protein
MQLPQSGLPPEHCQEEKSSPYSLLRVARLEPIILLFRLPHEAHVADTGFSLGPEIWPIGLTEGLWLQAIGGAAAARYHLQRCQTTSGLSLRRASPGLEDEVGLGHPADRGLVRHHKVITLAHSKAHGG